MSQAVRPATGLFANVWQLGYVTTDLEQGMQVLRDRFGVDHCTEVPTAGATFLDGDTPAPWDVRNRDGRPRRADRGAD